MRVLCFDTETTGLGKHSQIIQFSGCDSKGKKVMNYFIRPSLKRLYSEGENYGYIRSLYAYKREKNKENGHNLWIARKYKLEGKNKEKKEVKWLAKAYIEFRVKKSRKAVRNLWKARKYTRLGHFMRRWREAREVNEISLIRTMVSPSLSWYRKRIQKEIDRADIIMGYNILRFDIKKCESFGISFKRKEKRDIMLEYAPYSGIVYKNGKPKSVKLVTAASNIGYKFKAHDSLNDCRATVKVAEWIDKQKK